HVVAMLLHQLSVFFLPVAIAGLLLQAKKGGSNGARRIIKYVLCATALTVGVYYLVFHAAAGTWSLSRFAAWITYFSPENGFSFHAAGNIGYPLRSQIRVFFGGRAPFVREFGGPMLISLAGLTIIVVSVLIFTVLRRWQEMNAALAATSRVFP